MKSTNWRSKNNFISPPGFSFHRRAGSFLLLLLVLGTIPHYCKGINYRKISQLNPPYGSYSPQNPIAISLSPTDRIFLLDSQLAVAVEITAGGSSPRQFGGPGTDIEQFSDPADIGARSGLDIFIADRGNNRIVRLNRKLSYLADFRSLSGTHSNLLFENPLSVVKGLRGDLFIADGSNDRILKIDPTGRPIFSFGDYGQGQNSLLKPRRLELDPLGGLWVLDASAAVVHFDEYGGYIEILQSEVAGYPNGLAVSENAVWVCSDSLMWVYNRNTRRATTSAPQKMEIPDDVAMVDLAYQNQQLWILDSSGAIHRYQVSEKK